MKKINLFYIVVLPLLILFLYKLDSWVRISHHEFFGEAEAKHIEINLNQDVMVTHILAERGTHVKKGDLLMKVQNLELDENINQINFDLEGMESDKLLDKSEIQARINELEQKKTSVLAELSTKYKEIQSEADFYKTLATSAKGDSIFAHPSVVMLASLKEEMKSTEKEYNDQMAHYKKMMYQVQNSNWKNEQLEQKKRYFQKSKEFFDVVAPHDGTIGNINVRVGEHIKSYISLISFMEPNPTLIKAYVQEKYNVKLKVGDTVAVKPVYIGERQYKGVISAIGHRIVEIPEKFRKVPSIKLYGIEVFIKPEANRFFQNQIVRVYPWESEK
jgi:multidrug resistance efflux pump